MNILYVARVCRHDLLFAVNALARTVSNWTLASDKKLLRLISYMHASKSMKSCAIMGDNRLRDLTLSVFVDAGGDGGITTTRSTTGLFIALIGPCTFWPILAMSKRQTVVSRSSTESEVTAVDTALRTEAISILYFLHQVQGVLENTAPDAGGGSGPASHDRRKITSVPEFTEFAQKQKYDNAIQTAKLLGNSKLEAPADRMKMLVLEDNEAAIKILEKGRSMAIRHVARTHRISIEWLREVLNWPEVYLRYIHTRS